MTKTRQIIHIDMDAFYASVEQRDHPQLRGKPVIVAGEANERGVVSAASYEARRFGIHSAMPTGQALRLCPKVVVLPVRMSHYVDVSREIHTVFERYTPLVEPISLDEAFLDVTASTNLFGSAETIGRRIKEEIKTQTDLTASVGIAPNKFLAKLASDLDKPDGFVVITEANRQTVLDPLSVGRIWGIGKVTEKALRTAGIETIGALRQCSTATLQGIVGNVATELQALARGEDERDVEPQRQRKSVSSERTFAKDVVDANVLLKALLEEVEEVARRLRDSRLTARTVTLKLRYGDFRTVTRRQSLNEATNLTQPLWEAARSIFDAWRKSSPGALRLLGFGASSLKPEGAGQATLFADPQAEKLRRLDKVTDQIQRRYGRGAVGRGK